jgi:hypothetical protein
MAWRLRRAIRARSIERLPGRVAGLDEYPSVPFYTFEGKVFYYDSSGLGYQLERHTSAVQGPLPLEPGLRFTCQLIDEAFDEFGLYMVHHNRWVVSAATNRMGEFTSQEMRKLLPLGLIRDGGHRGSAGSLYLHEGLRALLKTIAETFMPLMRQNAAAYRAAVARGQTLFNEAAVDQREALCDGTLMDQPFRTVVKSFQVPVWQDLCQSWNALEESQREPLQALCPQLTDAGFACE